MEVLGHVVRLQVQVAPLKRGERPDRWYDAGRIRRVEALELTSRGCVAPDAGVDVHHRDHPASRFRGDNGLSVMGTAEYASLRSRFGGHLAEGCAGENVLLERSRPLTGEDLAEGVTVETADGDLALTGARPIEPCVEFSRYVVADPTRPVREPLEALRHGARGWCVTVPAGASALLREGDRVLRGTRT